MKKDAHSIIVRNSRKCYPRAKARGATHFLKKRVSAMQRKA